ncbi:hypothetical protein BOTBODRAFT_166414 [Botryobasidium botryosum FD-172 SS1]|uniref:tripeptidyl-peptidase II n=1 Tax=Botryobasidium botryosum (strain FD-172 SS1) TaxID=930990 RepID=A0A067LXJ7_BOTB1|nr:hypothetical protein BOTBODRAFT_166414 [Botryobasidium botryosum FD-172 SS1]
MRVLPFLFSATLFSVASASLTRRFGAPSVLESRLHIPSGWSKRDGLDKRAAISMRINLKQNNLDRGEELLIAVSDPDSPKYGQHYSPEEVMDLFAPSKQSVDAVRDWLVGAGLLPHRVVYSHPHGALLLNVTIAEAEDLLQAEYNIYEHESGQPHIACTSYSVPHKIKQHVDFIMPTVHFDAKVRRDDPDVPVARSGAKLSPDATTVAPAAAAAAATDLETCDVITTPDCLRALYEFASYKQRRSRENSYGVVEFSPNSYLPSDLDQFAAIYAPNAVGYRPKLRSIDGGALQTTQTGFLYNGESDLDLEYSIALLYPTPITLFQIGAGGSFNNFLGAFDKHYCRHLDPSTDLIYSHPTCGTVKPTHVIGISYSYNEVELTPSYERRQCHEYLKLGLTGVTVLFASGDNGVAGGDNQCIDPVTGQETPVGTKFNPTFPSTCPYVTSVGGTQINPGSTVNDPESACEEVIFSGGGFSNVFKRPEYQEKALHQYFKDHNPGYTAAQYNQSHARGFPDISANAANYITAIDGTFSLVYGTSASVHVVGSIVTLINDARLVKGKGPVGFINPVLYKHPEMMNDITSGNNPGCGTTGFTAVEGWDPVTGLGTPNFPRMLKVFTEGREGDHHGSHRHHSHHSESHGH